MIIRWKSVQLLNGKEQIVQNEAKAIRFNVHYNYVYYWSNDDKWMYSLDLRVVKDVRIYEDTDNVNVSIY